tara:strand:- start:402 stop:530 length:129 start_codon:yes stop_codon:yes gene_type:complete
MNINKNLVIVSAIIIAVIYMYYTKEADDETKKETYCAMCAGK